jgi:CheY-like chemotaxis protein
MPLPTVLYVEDDPNDAYFGRHAWKKAGVENFLEIVPGVEEAISHLSGEGPYADRVRHPLAGLVLLDLKMPGVSGLNLLRWIRSQPTLVHSPVIIVLSSDNPSDIKSAQALHIEGYLIKPGRLDEWVGLVKSLVKNWIPRDQG